MFLRVEVLVMMEPATGGEFRENAGGEQGHADGEGADDPVQFHAAFEHEPVEQGQHKNQHGRLGKERRAAMGCDGDQIEKRGALFWDDPAARRNKGEANGRGWSIGCGLGWGLTRFEDLFG